MMFPITLKTSAAGIPCKVKVTRYKKRKGNFSSFALDPEEFYGWTELNYRILDRKGYKADWLRNKLDEEGLTEDFEQDLMQELDDYLKAEKEIRKEGF